MMGRWILGVIAALGMAPSAQASAWVNDTEVWRLGTYQHADVHYVWFSKANPECSTTPYFKEGSAGGKALMAVLTMALVNGRKLDVQFEGCDIVEVYLR